MFPLTNPHTNRPLLFYVAIEGVFLFKHCMMLSMGFKAHCCKGFTYYTYGDVPPRTNGGPKGQVAEPPQQPDTPILFMHGVGVSPFILPLLLLVKRHCLTFSCGCAPCLFKSQP